jgi:hypothetical protein
LSAGGSPTTTELPSLKSATAGKAAHLTATAEMPAPEACAHMATAAEGTTAAAAVATAAAPARQSAGGVGGSS